MGRNSNNERRLLIAVLTFLISLSSMITGTLAWFSSSNYLEVDRFKITVGDQEKIEFGLVVPQGLHPDLGTPGEIAYFTDLDRTILQSYGYLNPWDKFKPVSSMFQSMWLNESINLLDEEVFSGVFPQFRSHYSGLTNTKEANRATSGFYQFEFYMRSNLDLDLYLDDESTLLADEMKNRQVANQNGLSVQRLNRIKDYMRVSFLTEEGFKIWEPNVLTPSQTKFGGRLDVLSYDGYYDYDILTDKEIMFGEYNGDEFLVYNEEARVTNVETYNSFSALTNPLATPLNIPASEANGLVIAQEQTFTTAMMIDQSNVNHRLVHLRPNRPTRMVVSIYAEGWDHDAVTETQFASFLLNLKLTGKITHF